MNKQKGLAFDDVLVAPRFSDVSRAQVDTSISLTENIRLNIPFMSAGMDTVTESKMAIAMARCGGIGIIHRHMSIKAQANEVDRVKRSEHGVISDPFFLSPNHYVYEADKLMAQYHISGVPIIEHDKLVGIITNRDLRFETDYSKKVYEVMTKDNLITAPFGTTIEEAKELLTKHKVEKLPLVDEQGHLKGLITIKDINKSIQYPLSAKDSQGRLLAGAAVGIKDDFLERVQALYKRKVDIIALEVMHGHAKEVIAAIKHIKGDFPSLTVMVGNVATADGVIALKNAGADIIKIGIGPSSSSTKRVVSGIGIPQITAIIECKNAAENTPLIADGGIRCSGDIVKAIAAGASACMIGNLIAGCDESPGTTELFQGRKYKVHKGMEDTDYVHAEDYQTQAAAAISTDGRITYKGNLAEVLQQLVDGFTVGMSYAGCRTIQEMNTNASLIEITQAGFKESHSHGAGGSN